jgi:tRNA modification GTPase
MVMPVASPSPAPTIYALSSGAPPSGVAVIRVSGALTRFVLETIADGVPEPRFAALRRLRDREGAVLDSALVLFFPAPHSFTGEDVAELHVHGGRAVVAAVLGVLRGLGLQQAEAGAFTRRAFDNGKLDLTEVEGLADLIEAETEAQRRFAMRQAGGAFSRRANDWRLRILAARALLEAELDFADEDDIPGSVSDGAWLDVAGLVGEIAEALGDGHYGERLRGGFAVAILGPPNAGKSTLLNRLARRDVAIVSSAPGTTRDLLEVHLDLEGLPVTLVDTAGIRETADAVEQEGIRRARKRAEMADLIVWLDETGSTPPPADIPGAWHIRTKVDSGGPGGSESHALSAVTDVGMAEFLAAILGHLRNVAPSTEPLIARERQRACLVETHDALVDALVEGPLEIRAEALRRAGDALGRLVGRIDVEDVLGAIFSSFCVGK